MFHQQNVLQKVLRARTSLTNQPLLRSIPSPSCNSITSYSRTFRSQSFKNRKTYQIGISHLALVVACLGLSTLKGADRDSDSSSSSSKSDHESSSKHSKNKNNHKVISIDDTKPFPWQLGGFHSKEATDAFLLYDDKLLKPQQSGKKGKMEEAFYQHIQHVNSPLKTLSPSFYGIVTVRRENGKETDYLQLEDVTRGYRKPCIIDIKIGKHTWDEQAGPEKQESERIKVPVQDELGFRYVGAQIYDVNKQDFKTFKKYGRSKGDHTPVAYCELMVPLFPGEAGQKAIRPLLKQLDEILTYMKKQREYRIYASSLLFVYEGDVQTDKPLPPKVVMIDFGHVTLFQHDVEGRPHPLADIAPISKLPPSEPDTNYITGIETIMRILSAMEKKK
jgi:1D-myo-inositol-tetrakisphosphate 5-kinase/inositol-polyphosphate multikinase